MKFEFRGFVSFYVTSPQNAWVADGRSESIPFTIEHDRDEIADLQYHAENRLFVAWTAAGSVDDQGRKRCGVLYGLNVERIGE